MLAFFVGIRRGAFIVMSGVGLEFVPNSLYYGDCLDVLGEYPPWYRREVEVVLAVRLCTERS